MYSVDLNCDLGESFGTWKKGLDEQIIPLVTSANIACGYHASDPDVMAYSVSMARKSGTVIGAHPGYPDLQGFGRRPMSLTLDEAKHCVMYQIGALSSFTAASGSKLRYVKLHGALYNEAAKNYELASAIADGIKAVDSSLMFLGLCGSVMMTAAENSGLRCIQEVFADRAYEEDGTLVSRRKSGAVITDEKAAVARVIRMITEGAVTSITGKDIPIRADSVCVHGDNEHALEFVRSIRDACNNEGIVIRSFAD